jgi:hypothetical protein
MVKTREHRTARGALLSALEHKCVSAGHYVVEGYTVRHVVRPSQRRYLVNPRITEGWRKDHWEITAPWLKGCPVHADTFTEALEWIGRQKGL